MVNKVLGNNIKVVYYGSTLKNLLAAKYAPYLRKHNTVKQKRVAKLLYDSVLLICRSDHNVKLVNGVYKTPVGLQLILTNLIMDAISNVNNHLLESHTGVIRTKLDWYTKYHPIANVDMSIFPPLYRMMLFLGTKDLFTPLTLSHLRNDLVNTAIERGWSAITTEEQVKLGMYHNQTLYNNYEQTPVLT